MTSNEPVLDLFSPDLCQNPYPTYDILRELGPIYDDRKQKLSVISGFADARRVLQNSLDFSSNRASFEHTLLGADGSAHIRVRGAVADSLDRGLLARLKTFVDSYASAIISKLADAGRGEIVADLAVRLPVCVAVALLGLDESREEEVGQCAHAIVEAGNILSSRHDRDVQLRRSDDFRIFLAEHFCNRHDPSALALDCLYRDDAGLTMNERIDVAMLLIAAATQTTTSLIANAVQIMLRDFSVLPSLQRDQRLIPPFIEEVLRYESPVQRISRTALRDVELSGRVISAGADLLVLLGAANRDPAAFARASTFDVHRHPNNHLSFGHGPHHCLGLALSRLETISVITSIVNELSSLALIDTVGPIAYNNNLTVRSPMQLKVGCIRRV
jgi:cytochrome P450